MTSAAVSKDQAITGIFVGNPLSFSDTLMNLVNAELSFVRCVRTASLSDILFSEDDFAQAVQLVVVDETMWGDLVMLGPRLREKFANANLVLAYRKAATARRMIQACSEAEFECDIGYLPMNVQVDCWLSVLRILVCGERFMPSELLVIEPQDETLSAPEPAETVVKLEASSPENAPGVICDDFGLTERELQVLKAVSEGKQNKIIAEELSLSQHTVKLHMHHVMSKLGIHNRTEAAIWYLGRHAEQASA